VYSNTFPLSLFSLLSPSLHSLSSLFPFPLSSLSLSVEGRPRVYTCPRVYTRGGLGFLRALGFTRAAAARARARRRRRARAIEVEEGRERGERTYGAGTTAAHGGEDCRGKISAA
jgi:hypothetical protein